MSELVPDAGAVAGAPRAPARPVVLVGLMGAGKTVVGRRLARLLGVSFRDADEEIAAAAGMSIPDIFELYGETAFRDLERRVIARLMRDPPGVLALGGGAFVDPEVRRLVKTGAISVWLRADLETLLRRTERRRHARPLLATGDPRETLHRLMEARYPLYAEADLVVDTGEQPVETVVTRIRDLLADRVGPS
ncbi:MAG TPA: shikimate kinase [Rhodospirillales bacterium]|nr:shikimate kinase [Rhodospirillales bacterium]